MNIDTVLEMLDRLVAFDTRNPPRELSAQSPLFAWIIETLGKEFSIEVQDHGLGRVSLLAVRGAPSVLFNVHLDTVPTVPGSRFPALQATRQGQRVYGRGSCDTKGAAACLLALAGASRDPLALLFSSDEEAPGGCCVRAFVDAPRIPPFAVVVVAEPTRCKPVLSHRGYLCVDGTFSGQAGHSSRPGALRDNALHKLAAWVTAAVDEATDMERRGCGACFNVGEVHGGTRPNIVAAEATVSWSARLPPGADHEAFLQRICGLGTGAEARWQQQFSGPPLPQSGSDVRAAQAWLDARGMKPAPAVDFWTEAALFAAAGIPALVFGPGDIAQAHAVDEWVEVAQLNCALDIYRHWVCGHA